VDKSIFLNPEFFFLSRAIYMDVFDFLKTRMISILKEYQLQYSTLHSLSFSNHPIVKDQGQVTLILQGKQIFIFKIKVLTIDIKLEKMSS
jgi:hypothetical protein